MFVALPAVVEQLVAVMDENASEGLCGTGFSFSLDGRRRIVNCLKRRAVVPAAAVTWRNAVRSARRLLFPRPRSRSPAHTILLLTAIYRARRTGQPRGTHARRRPGHANLIPAVSADIGVVAVRVSTCV